MFTTHEKVDHEPPARCSSQVLHRPRPHGHQFRTYNPQIGDGRGFLFAQLRDSQDRLLDLGTKGSGQTPYSRSGDGRLTLKGAVREVLASEMLEALGVYTSKTFAIYETGEQLHRGDEPSPTRSAVLTRLQHSHLRFGVFQRHAYFDRPDLIGELVDYAIAHLVPEAGSSEGDRAAALLAAVSQRSARLAAQWMAAGFVHGVLNTDNLVVTGESFDYGPWRFLPHFEPGFTAAYFDEQGLEMPEVGLTREQIVQAVSQDLAGIDAEWYTAEQINPVIDELLNDRAFRGSAALRHYSSFVYPKSAAALANAQKPQRAATIAQQIAFLVREQRAAKAEWLRNVDRAAHEMTRQGAERHPLHLVLDNLRSAHNVGNILRCAEAARCTKVYHCGITPTPPEPKLLKTAMGSADYVPIASSGSTLEVVQELDVL